jgi:hypothetical protein
MSAVQKNDAHEEKQYPVKKYLQGYGLCGILFPVDAGMLELADRLD